MKQQLSSQDVMQPQIFLVCFSLLTLQSGPWGTVSFYHPISKVLQLTQSLHKDWIPAVCRILSKAVQEAFCRVLFLLSYISVSAKFARYLSAALRNALQNQAGKHIPVLP